MTYDRLDKYAKTVNTLLRFVATIVGVAAAYFLTIQSIKLELAAKADSAAVEALGRKLGNIEVLIREGVVTKEQFFEFSKDVETRLTRIEFYLRDGMGEEEHEG